MLRQTIAPRSVVIGPAGAGKSVALRYLRDRYEEAGRTVVFARRADELAATAPEQVLIVDDAHLLDDAAVQVLRDRIGDPDAAMIVACRPWPLPSGVAALLTSMDTPGTSVVLGQVSAADMRDQLPGDPVATACVDDLVQLCGGTTWLVSEALAMHDAHECAAGPAHRAIAQDLQEVIAQRLQNAPADVRMAVEVAALGRGANEVPLDHGDDIVAAAYAHGLLLRNGQATPIVSSAVRALTSVDRIIALSESGLIQPSAELLGGVRNENVARALLQLGDATQDPRRSLELYDHAVASGADAIDVAVRRSRALWAAGLTDEAAAAADGLAPSPDDPDATYVTSVVASAWLARGLPETADAVYRANPGGDAALRTGAIIAALAAGDPDGLAEVDAHPAQAVPTTVAVAMQTLARGLRKSLTPAAQDSLGELLRASDAFTLAGSEQPLPEVPAVLATIVAINLGEVEVAANILDAAVRDGQGGASARMRMTLWRGWVAMMQQHPAKVDAALAAAAREPLSPRDRLLDHALRIGLARRYSDTAGITAAWRAAREAMLHANFDLYGILPLSEFVMTGALIKDSTTMQAHFDQALERVERLGTPLLWSSHLHWAGIQQGILLGQPEILRPHARVLVEAATASPVAAAMAHAGRVWTNVLGGTVEEESVEAAADQLAEVGLAWDGSRLAGYGAGLSEDRRTISRLLACARRLHSNVAAQSPSLSTSTPDVAPSSSTTTTGTSKLSAREREVAALVLRGKTYAEIGSTIFISPRTAEHHIARIRQRLGATSRSDLLTKLRVALDEGADDAD